jgi:hypothetical protein
MKMFKNEGRESRIKGAVTTTTAAAATNRIRPQTLSLN